LTKLVSDHAQDNELSCSLWYFGVGDAQSWAAETEQKVEGQTDLSYLEAVAAAPTFSDTLPFAFPTLLLYVAFELPSSEVKLEGKIEVALRLEDAAAAD
jgi:hypothetical protein